MELYTYFIRLHFELRETGTYRPSGGSERAFGVLIQRILRSPWHYSLDGFLDDLLTTMDQLIANSCKL